MSWQLAHRPGQVHIYPVGDLTYHLLTRDCPCLPTVERHPRGLLVIHHRWDRREATAENDDRIDRTLPERLA